MLTCPFCGSKPFVGKHSHYPGKYIVRCGSSGEDCKFFPSSGPIEKKDLPDYEWEWNSRCYSSKSP